MKNKFKPPRKRRRTQAAQPASPRPRFHDLVVGRWHGRFMGRRFSLATGRAGFVRGKREGDRGTPSGCWRVIGGCFRPDRLRAFRSALAIQPMGLRFGWSDDGADARYNRLVMRPCACSHERLWRADGLYDLLLLTDYNSPPVAGKGSAIFLHVWRGPRKPTEGCIAFAHRDLLWIARRWRPDSRLFAGCLQR